MIFYAFAHFLPTYTPICPIVTWCLNKNKFCITFDSDFITQIFYFRIEKQ